MMQVQAGAVEDLLLAQRHALLSQPPSPPPSQDVHMARVQGLARDTSRDPYSPHLAYIGHTVAALAWIGASRQPAEVGEG